MHIALNLSRASTQAFQAIEKVNIFFLKPVKVFSEFLSLLETYETSQPFSKINLLSKLTNNTKSILDGTFGTIGLLKFMLNFPTALSQSKVTNACKYVLGAVSDLKDAQDFFTTFNPNKYIPLPSIAPLSFVSKALQQNISSHRLLLVGILRGLWQIKDSFDSISDLSSAIQDIKNKTRLRQSEESWKDISYALTILEAITGIAYNCFKVLGNNSKLHSWAKFGLLTASTGFKVAAFYTKPSEIDHLFDWIDKNKDSENNNLRLAYLVQLKLMLTWVTCNFDENQMKHHLTFNKENPTEWQDFKKILSTLKTLPFLKEKMKKYPGDEIGRYNPLIEDLKNLDDPEIRNALKEAARIYYTKKSSKSLEQHL